MAKSAIFYPEAEKSPAIAVALKKEGQPDKYVGDLYYHKLVPWQERKKGETVHDLCPSVWEMSYDLVEWFRNQPFSIRFTIAPKWKFLYDAKLDVEYFMSVAEHFAERALFPGYAVWESEMWILYEERPHNFDMCRFIVRKEYPNFLTRNLTYSQKED